MDTFVLDAQASEVRAELIKERKRRFELEARIRTLEQRLEQGPKNNGAEVPDSKRRPNDEERVGSEILVSPRLAAAAGMSRSGTPERPRSAHELSNKRSESNESPRAGSPFNLEAERDWLATVRLPGVSALESSSLSLTESQGSSEPARNSLGYGSSYGDGANQEEDLREPSLEDSDLALGPSLSNTNTLRPRFSAPGAGGDSSPTLSGLDPRGTNMSSYGSAWSLSEGNGANNNGITTGSGSGNSSTRRRYDENVVRLSQLKLELSEYKHAISELSSQAKTYKARSEYLQGELADSESRVEILRKQVREKNEMILSLQDERKHIVALRSQLEEATREKIALQVKLNVSERAHAATAESEEVARKECEKLREAVSVKDIDISKKEDVMSKMAEKLVQLKLQLQAIVPHICKFSVSTVTRFSKPVIVSIGVLKPQGGGGAAQLSVSSSHHSRELEIVTSGKRVTHPASSVVSIAHVPNLTDRFNVTYRNGHVDTFETPKCPEIVVALNKHLFDASPDLDLDMSSSY